MIHKVININKVKFNTLKTLLDDYRKEKIVNVHIDLHSILGDLYKESTYSEINWLEDDNSMAISSCILNIVAHYRLFFHNTYGASTKFFLYFSDERPDNNREELKEFGIKFFGKFETLNDEKSTVNNEVLTNLKLCKTICPYIPGVYYIDSKKIDPLVACAYMLTKYSEDNLVLTKDEYWYQVINVPNTSVLRLKRDDSYLVTRKNVYENLLKKAKFKPEYLSSELLSVVLSFAGVKSRDVSGIKGYGYSTIIKTLDKAVDRRLISNKWTSMKNTLDEIYTGKDEAKLIQNFKAIDITYQLNLLTKGQKERLDSQIVSRYNKRDLIELNNKHYTEENSLMLEELFKGVSKIDKFSW